MAKKRKKAKSKKAKRAKRATPARKKKGMRTARKTKARKKAPTSRPEVPASASSEAAASAIPPTLFGGLFGSDKTDGH